MDQDVKLVRHTLAAVAYRATRALEDAPESFASFDMGGGRSPVTILAHMGDLFEWSLSIIEGQARWKPSTPLGWADEQKRFFRCLGAFDAYLASGSPLHAPLEKLMQGPVADSLTHVGQLAMLRRLAGYPTKGESFYAAEIACGQVSAKQPAPAKPFSAAK